MTRGREYPACESTRVNGKSDEFTSYVSVSLFCRVVSHVIPWQVTNPNGSLILVATTGDLLSSWIAFVKIEATLRPWRIRVALKGTCSWKLVEFLYGWHWGALKRLGRISRLSGGAMRDNSSAYFWGILRAEFRKRKVSDKSLAWACIHRTFSRDSLNSLSPLRRRWTLITIKRQAR